MADLFSFVSATTDAASLLISESVMKAIGKVPAAVPPPEAVSVPPTVPAAAAPVRELNTSVRGTGNGGVVTPF